MVKMVRVLLVVLVCALLAGAVHAQQMKLDDMKTQMEMVAQLAAFQLNLTDEQQTQLRTVAEQTKASCEAIIKGSGDEVAKVAKIEEAVNGAIKNGMGVLTDAQKTSALILAMSVATQYGGSRSIALSGAEIKDAMTNNGIPADKAQVVLDAAKAFLPVLNKIYSDDSVPANVASVQALAAGGDAVTAISNKLSDSEKTVMTAVVKMLGSNYQTFMSCLSDNQRVAAITLGEQLLKALGQSISIK